jgi:hypothetical protein
MSLGFKDTLAELGGVFMGGEIEGEINQEGGTFTHLGGHTVTNPIDSSSHESSVIPPFNCKMPCSTYQLLGSEKPLEAFLRLSDEDIEKLKSFLESLSEKMAPPPQTPIFSPQLNLTPAEVLFNPTMVFDAEIDVREGFVQVEVKQLLSTNELRLLLGTIAGIIGIQTAAFLYVLIQILKP